MHSPRGVERKDMCKRWNWSSTSSGDNQSARYQPYQPDTTAQWIRCSYLWLC